MDESRADRVEEWYQQSAREMAEEIVDLEDEVADLKARLAGLEK